MRLSFKALEHVQFTTRYRYHYHSAYNTEKCVSSKFTNKSRKMIQNNYYKSYKIDIPYVLNTNYSFTFLKNLHVPVKFTDFTFC